MRILGVIPARGGSKTIPRKNLRLIAGKPLIAYPIAAALDSKFLDRTIVSTEDEEIAEVAKRYGAEVPFRRPEELARDEVCIVPVVQHAMRYLDQKEGWRADAVVSIQPTSPLLEATDIDAVIAKWMKTGCDLVVTVCRITHGHPYWAMKLEGDKLVPMYPKGLACLQKQDLPPVYQLNGALCLRERDALESWRGDYWGGDFAPGKDVRAVIMDEMKSIDIDTPLDLMIAEALIKKLKMKEGE